MKKIKKQLQNYSLKEILKDIVNKKVFLQVGVDILNHGLDKTSLEIARLGMRNTVYKRLNKLYRDIQDEYSLVEKKNGIDENTIWITWFTGLETAPDIVKVCVNSIYNNFPEKNIIFLSNDNINEYVEFPSHILEKRNSGIITDAHFSDLLRLELLSVYGGTWIDATVYISSPDIPKSMLESDLFFFQNLKPGRDGDAIGLSSWFIHAKKGHPIMLKTRKMLYKYWEDNNKLLDYFLFHFFLSISKDHFKESAESIPKYSNAVPHILQLEWGNEKDLERFKDILRMSSVHKLTYKNLPKKENTLYEYIVKKERGIYDI